MNASTADGNPIQQEPDNGSAEQLWELQPWGAYNIRAKGGLYVAAQGTGNGSAIVETTDPGASAAQWEFESAGASWYGVGSATAQNSLISASGASTSPGQATVLWPYNSASPGSQLVRIVPQLDATFKFYFQSDGQAWDANGNALDQNPNSGSDTQNFTLERVSGNSGNGSLGSGLPGGWIDADIGGPAHAGSAAYNANSSEWTLAGGGSDIWNQSDQFNFASESVSGDGAMVTGVTSVGNTDYWAKAGVMIRDSSAPNSIFVDLVGTPSQGVSFQYRNATGGSCAYTVTWSLPPLSESNPLWLKLVKNGSTYSGYYSISGSNWTLVGTANVNLTNSNYLTGMAVTAHNNGESNTATFVDTAFYPGSW